MLKHQCCKRIVLVAKGREYKYLGGYVLITACLRLFIGQIEQAVQLIGYMKLPAATLYLRQLVECLIQSSTKAVDIDTRLREQRSYTTAVLIKHGDHEMGGFNELMISPQSQ